MPLMVGRQRSLKALEGAELFGNLLLVVTQKAITTRDPLPEDLYTVGTLCKIESVTNTDTESRQIVVTGIARYQVAEYMQPDEFSNYLSARGEIVADVASQDEVRVLALLNNLKTLAREILELLPGSTEPLIKLINRVDDAGYLSNICAAYLNLSLAEKQALLENTSIESRIESLLEAMRKERDVLNVQHEIRDKLSERLNKSQREALLREQLRTIRTELGEEEGGEANEEIEQRLKDAKLSEDAAKQAKEELKKLNSLPAASAEYHVIRTYLELIASLPWSISTKDNIDLKRARQILDEDHYGLEQVKKRILQYLAVAKLKHDLHGPILCLVGPPGVGKTSLGQSIARALGRKFIRTSLGGVRDEAEIRGHRRTYVGAMPGRIIQSIKRAGSRNPLMMLDEIDKLRSDFHGDPSAAMLEVLDPEQNKSFTDHYLDVPFDLSDVFFVATANIVDTIPGPLRDRMEIIEVHGYTIQEKLAIAKNHLIPKELREHGFKPHQVQFEDEALIQVITHYTREAGVRELERKIAALLRGVAEQIVSTMDEVPEEYQKKVTLPELKSFLGPEKYFPEKAERLMKPGVATGLAWTPQGGDLIFIEGTKMPGKGSLILTGQLGEVMKESAQIALSLARSLSLSGKNIRLDVSNQDVHIHVPAGAIPKDGPSAGITIFSALVSLMLETPLPSSLGMTGEITLRGVVLPVGGIKEKVIAAHRAGLTTLIMSKKNQADIEDVPAEVKTSLEFKFVETLEEVMEVVFGQKATLAPVKISSSPFAA